MADRNDWDRTRDREQEMDRERGAHRLDYGRNREARGSDATRWENEGGRTESEREGRGNFPRYEDRSRNYQDDYRRDRERGEWSGGSRTADGGQRGDWGKQASWGTYGNRPGYDRRDERYDRREEPSHSGNPASRRNGEDYRYGGPQYGYSGGQYRGGELESSQYGGQYIGEYGGRSTGRSEGQHNQMGGMSAGHSGGMFGGGMPSGGYGGGMGSYSGGFGEQGRHAGRGPKNWQRSDDRIKEDVNERLTEHSHIDATEIDIAVKNGEVTVSGSVDDRRTKRLVEDLIEGVSGVKEVHNQLRSNHAFQQEGTEKVKSATSQSSEGQTAGGQSRK